MDAALVYDGWGPVRIPPSMGTPLPDQMCGTLLENLGEVASRICYDSMGLDANGKRRGRSGVALHQHILEVKNLSVYEHCVVTVCFPKRDDLTPMDIATTCLNRKGVHVLITRDWSVEITANFRAILEWGRYTLGDSNNWDGYAADVGRILRHFASNLAPTIFGSPTLSPFQDAALKVENLTDDQAHVSLWLKGSRGFTHEQVRHRFAMSQRSTRYCDESISPYIVHPLIEAYFDDTKAEERSYLDGRMARSMMEDRLTYKALVEALEVWGIRKGLDKTQARKQARGAARGYLGNALESEMIFSAPVSGWKWMLQQRKNALADAEAREIYSPVLDALKSSRYGDRFAEYDTAPSPDGIGTVLVRRGWPPQ